MIAHPDTAPQVVKEAQAMICWLSESPLDRARTYALRQTTRTVKAKIADIPFRLDINTLAQDASPTQLQMNDIATINLRLAQPICCDSYKNNRNTGAFILIDEATNNTVGAGMLL
jgi:sulfate adenylyltransferase subunit 1